MELLVVLMKRYHSCLMQPSIHLTFMVSQLYLSFNLRNTEQDVTERIHLPTALTEIISSLGWSRVDFQLSQQSRHFWRNKDIIAVRWAARLISAGQVSLDKREIVGFPHLHSRHLLLSKLQKLRFLRSACGLSVQKPRDFQQAHSSSLRTLKKTFLLV